ncbi:MAG: hypothetical protein EOO02_21530 [Chitinophagaceae bacterium]|nr:MAG: hypothetical protein EOO02_21530 [Chitinophagaceae bacterium]
MFKDNQDGNGRVFIMCMPGEYKGAYVFRNAFSDLLLMNSIDTAGFKAAGYIGHAEQLSLPSVIEPRLSGDTMFFGLSAFIVNDTISVSNFDKPADAPRFISLETDDKIWYWNKKQLIQFKR